MQSITLLYPVTFNGTTTSQLEMRRPKVIDQLSSSKKTGTELEKEIFLFSNLCQVEEAFILELDQKDYAQLQKAFADFFTEETTKKA
jgi:hypothetical protein